MNDRPMSQLPTLGVAMSSGLKRLRFVPASPFGYATVIVADVDDPFELHAQILTVDASELAMAIKEYTQGPTPSPTFPKPHDPFEENGEASDDVDGAEVKRKPGRPRKALA